MRLLTLLILAGCGLACSSQSVDKTEAASTQPAITHNGVLRDTVGDRFGIEGTVRGESTLR